MHKLQELFCFRVAVYSDSFVTDAFFIVRAFIYSDCQNNVPIEFVNIVWVWVRMRTAEITTCPSSTAEYPHP